MCESQNSIGNVHVNPHVNWQDRGGLEAEFLLKPLVHKKATAGSKSHMPSEWNRHPLCNFTLQTRTRPPNTGSGSLNSSFGKWNYTRSQGEHGDWPGFASCKRRLVGLSVLRSSVSMSLVDLENFALWNKM